jgi:hypothetical protein
MLERTAAIPDALSASPSLWGSTHPAVGDRQEIDKPQQKYSDRSGHTDCDQYNFAAPPNRP